MKLETIEVYISKNYDIQMIELNSQNIGILKFDHEMVTESSSLNVEDSSLFHVVFETRLVLI